MNTSLIVAIVVTALVIFLITRTAIIIPQQHAYVVERLGKFSKVIGAGWHILMPFVDVVRYRHALKESILDTPKQECITKDNVHVSVDALLYYKILDPERASYGVDDYRESLGQLSQTLLRSEIGRLELDRVLEERYIININVVKELDKASEPWGVKVIRYEVQHIDPPKDVLEAMEKQMRAEREKRATVLVSEGQRDATINSAEASKVLAIKTSEATRIQNINEAEGEAEAILAIAEAKAKGIERIAEAISKPGGYEATKLHLASHYIEQFGKLAKEGNTLVLPANMADVGSMLTLATEVLNKKKVSND